MRIVSGLFISIMLVISLVYSGQRSYTYVMPGGDESWTMKLDLAQDINPKDQYAKDYYVCIGETENIANYVEYGTTFTNMKITSYCDKQTDGSCTSDKYYKTSSYGMSGTMARLSDEENKIIHQDLPRFNNIQMLTNPPYSNEELEIIKKILTGKGGAWMKAYPEDNGIKYADNKGGIGCTGTYKIEVTRPDRTIANKQGGIDKFGSYNFEFTQEGDYSILYETSLTECGGFMEERVRGEDSRAHPFVEKHAGVLPFKIQKTLVVHSVPSNRVELDENGGFIGTAPECPQGVSCDGVVPEKTEKEIQLYLRVKNTGDTDVKIRNMLVSVPAGSYLQVKKYSIVPTGEQTLKKNSEITYKLNVTLYAKEDGSQHSPQKLFVEYTYHATSLNPCTGNYEQGTGDYEYAIAIVSEPPPGDGLVVPVAIEPKEINVENYQSINSNGVKVLGNVSVLPNNLVPCKPGVEPCEGARVRLEGLSKYICTDFFGHNLCARSSDCITSELETITDENGMFKFDIKDLGDCKFKVDENGYLQADVHAEFMGLTKDNSTSSNINTVIPPLQCRIKIDKINRQINTESYDFSVELIDKNPSMSIESYKYDCGDGNGIKNANDLKYTCIYKVDESTAETSKRTVFRIEYKKDGVDESTVCTMDVGLCQVYIE